MTSTPRKSPKLPRLQNPSKRLGFSQFSLKGWIFVLKLSLPKPLGGNDSQMSLRILIQPKRPQELRFKEITKETREGGYRERKITKTQIKDKIDSDLEATRTRGGKGLHSHEFEILIRSVYTDCSTSSSVDLNDRKLEEGKT